MSHLQQYYTTFLCTFKCCATIGALVQNKQLWIMPQEVGPVII